MTLRQRIHYIWVRAGLVMLVAMPVAMYLTFRPWGVASDTLTTNAAVAVSRDDAAIVFTPSVQKKSGLLLLPGCPVDPVAYAPLARSLADEGYLSVIVKIPFRCASLPGLEQQLDQRVMALAARWPAVKWVLAGHSRGAAHVTRLAASHSDQFAWFILMGTSHPRDYDLSALPIMVTKIAASNDGVAGAAQYDTRRLPAATTWVRIDGGNHSQFGYYGFQLFDHVADISREQQQLRIAVALLDALRSTELNR